MSRDYRSPDLEGSGNLERKREEGYTEDLNSRAANWPTPTARDHKDTGPNTNYQHAADKCRLVGVVMTSGPLAPTATGPTFPKTSGRRLNPLFVEMLMGLPRGWTDFVPLETGSFRKWRRLHSWHSLPEPE